MEDTELLIDKLMDVVKDVIRNHRDGKITLETEEKKRIDIERD